MSPSKAARRPTADPAVGGGDGATTAEGRLRAQLRERERELEEARSLLRLDHQRLHHAERLAAFGVVAAGRAREINDPLTGAIGLARALRAGDMAPQRALQYADAIVEALQRIRVATVALLDAARVRLPVRSRFRTAEMIASCLRLLAPVIRDRSLRMSVRVPDEHQLWAERTQMMQAVVNVVLHAIRSAPPGADITISTEQRSDRALLRVSVAGDLHPDPFAAGELGPERPGQPDDIEADLAIAQSIVYGHDGGLSIDHEADGCTTIILWIPTVA